MKIYSILASQPQNKKYLELLIYVERIHSKPRTFTTITARFKFTVSQHFEAKIMKFFITLESRLHENHRTVWFREHKLDVSKKISFYYSNYLENA